MLDYLSDKIVISIVQGAVVKIERILMPNSGQQFNRELGLNVKSHLMFYHYNKQNK